MGDPNCARCRLARRGEAIRGRVTYRCFDPEGRLTDPSTGQPGRPTTGRVVASPMPREVAERLGIEAPAWCPRRRGEEGSGA